jgi:CBS domain-containing protein
MKTVKKGAAIGPVTLHARTAADLMTADPLSLEELATVPEAITFLTDKGFSAAPVIDETGRPVGVVSRSDILVHDRETVRHAVPEYYAPSELTIGPGERLPSGFEVEQPDYTRVRDIMTPVVLSVSPEAPAGQVVRNMLAWKVHRLFVVDDDGVLIGVITALDVLRHLQA